MIALYLATRDPRVPWYAKAVAACIAAYALSPIDLIPDFIPVLGYLDEVIILPLGIMLAVTVVIDAICLLAYAQIAARGARALKESRIVVWLERTLGAAMIIFGVKLIASK